MINIAEILKDCPKGTKLYSPLYGECEFYRIYERNDKKCIEIKSNAEIAYLNEDGRYFYSSGGECLLFPSVDQRDWTKFQIPIEPKFKVGDKIIRKGRVGKDYAIPILKIENGMYILPKSTMPIETQDDWKLVPNKFDITTLKPFDKVLVRDVNDEEWTPNLYGYPLYEKDKAYQCVLNYWNQCIPYEGNQHLLGTHDDCDDYYKTWK